MNVRRLVKEGRFTYAGKCLRVDLHRMFRGEVTGKVVDYEFGYESDHQHGGSDPTLTRLRECLADWSKEYNETLGRLSKGVKEAVEVQEERMGALHERLDALKEKAAPALRKVIGRARTIGRGQ